MAFRQTDLVPHQASLKSGQNDPFLTRVVATTFFHPRATKRATLSH